MKPFWCILLALQIISAKYHSSNHKFSHYKHHHNDLKNCLNQGLESGNNQKSCHQLPHSLNMQITSKNLKMCKASFIIGCLNATQNYSCEEGILSAKLNDKCDHHSESFKKCCNACKLGFEIQNVVGSCKNVLPSFDEQVVNVVHDCCEYENKKKFIDSENELTTLNSLRDNFQEAVGRKDYIHEGSGFNDETTLQENIYHDTHHKSHETKNVKKNIEDAETAPIILENPPPIEIFSPQILTTKLHSMCAEYISLCNEYETCIDVDNYYACICKIGFNRNSKTNECDDINECTEKSHKCEDFETCINEIGSYACEAPTNGFEVQVNSTIDNDVKYVDINECLDEPCGEGKTCINTEGSYECKAIDINGHHCEEGFELDDGDCVDINECKKGLCGEHEICTNLKGSHRCEKIECEKTYSKFLKSNCHRKICSRYDLKCRKLPTDISHYFKVVKSTDRHERIFKIKPMKFQEFTYHKLINFDKKHFNFEFSSHGGEILMKNAPKEDVEMRIEFEFNDTRGKYRGYRVNIYHVYVEKA